MSVQNPSNQEKFAILLEQLQLNTPPYDEVFQSGAIDKVVIQRGEKSWHFYLQLPQFLQPEQWDLLSTRLLDFFPTIEKLKISLSVTAEENKAEFAVHYWQKVMEQLRATPEILRQLREQKPVVDGEHLILTMLTKPEVEQINQKYLPKIKDLYADFGFKQLLFELRVDSEAEKAQLDEFIQEVHREDQELAAQSAQPVAEVTKMSKPTGEPIRIGRGIAENAVKEIDCISENDKRVAFEGTAFDVEIRDLRKGGFLLQMKVTDFTNSILVKMFSRDKSDEETMQQIKKGMWFRIQGNPQMDTYNRIVPELIFMAQDLEQVTPTVRQDLAAEDEKRVELHVHTQMSQLNATNNIADYVARAKQWGHKAIAVTDQAGIQAFPDAFAAGKKHDMKIIYGLEANLVDDGVPLGQNLDNRVLDDCTFVVFDVETTGLSAVYNTIIELAAVKIRDGEIIDRFSEFANPHHPLSAFTIELTHITDDMVENAPEVGDVLTRFREWTGDAVLVAHNASFDMGFLNVGYSRLGFGKATNAVLDTLEMARYLYPHFKRYRLDTIAKKLNVELTAHHRAIYDAEATGNVLLVMLRELADRKLTRLEELGEVKGNEFGYRMARPKHCTILVQNAVGLKNLFKLVSLAHTEYFYRVPRIPRSLLEEHREGLLIGCGCVESEVLEALLQKSLDEVVPIAEYYDFLEIHPKEYYQPLIDNETIRDEATLEKLLLDLVQMGEGLEKMVVATGNVHYLEPRDKIYREILVRSANPGNKKQLPEVHFRSTDEMLASLAFLGEEKVKELVVTNTNRIADLIEVVKPLKAELYTPKIEGADEEIREMSYQRAHMLYGNPLPENIVERLEKELKSIIGHGFAVIYLISHKLVKKSLDDGYLVGSRGSVGSSLVATMTEITEVNPLPPHYLCPSCQHSEFFLNGEYGSGFDLPDKKCPKCGTDFNKDGQDIPFEVFLGFKGDKVPDIDLNFSGEYQPIAHHYTKELFGEENVFRAGTIATVADKTAYGYTKGYLEEKQLSKRNVEIERLASGCTGVKRTTGQHPGGIIVIPDYMDVYDFTPIQYPADNLDAEWRTTHFDFHSIHDNVLKLDLLGHDDPTVVRMLQDLSGIDPKTVPTDDPEVMKIFSSPEPLGVTAEEIGSKTGSLGLPEFGTSFVRQMLEATKPSTFAELVQISGLSHGTDVWLGNAQELINSGVCQLKDVIGCRDDIMVALIYKGLEPSLAFKIMESVRKGKGLTEDMEEAMRANGVENWYIESCKKIKYMFPKAHAAAYVLMAVRIAYFKVHKPLYFYAAYFSIRAGDFDIDTMVRGANSIRAKLKEINDKGNEASKKELDLYTILEIALEMCARGFSFKKIDLYRSQATSFVIDGNSIILPFNTVPGLGDNVAKQIVSAREAGEFLSKEDLAQRGKVSKTVIEFLTNHGALDNMPDQNQLSFF